MISLRYRSDIDGLRAVAVLGVVIYHAFPWLIPGGFIGVDIFFVISGYLISGILYKGHKTGNFSFKEFYARRIRRLFPALITMLVITMAYGWLILLPDEFQQLGKHVAAGTLFIQNFVFWQESGYFDTAASLKPLLHLWSLAAEEQFYIFFPLLLLLLWRKSRMLVPAIGVLLIATFILNVVMSVQNSASDFFLTPYRAWEFLGGSLLAWWHYDKGHEEEVSLHREALSWGGLILLGIGMAFIHTGDPYPGWRAIVPVAGTLLLMEGGRGAWVNHKILSNPAVVWIGLISYPLYLFHWPALSFVHIVKGENPKAGYILAALGVALILTILTYYFIEKKIRCHKSTRSALVLIAVFILTSTLGVLVWKQKLVQQYNKHNDKNSKIENAIQDSHMLLGTKWITDPKDKIIVSRIGGYKKETLFFGDSNIMQYASRVIELIKNNNFDDRGAVFITTGGSLPIDGVKTPLKTTENLYAVFNDYLQHESAVDRIVIGARWHLYFDGNKYNPRSVNGQNLGTPEGESAAISRLGLMIKNLVAKEKKVFIILSSPSSSKMDPHKFYLRTFIGIKKDRSTPFYKDDFESKYGKMLSKIAMVAKSNGAVVIDPLDYLCTNGICIAEDEDGPIRFDEGHLRPGYVREHVKYLDQTVAP